MLTLAVTMLFSAGQFVLFSYFSPYWRQILGVTPSQLSVMFLGFGLFGFIGNALMSRHIDRVGVDRAVFISLGLVALSLAAWPLATSMVLAMVVCIPWALGCFSSNSAQQARLVAIAPVLAPASIALNSAAMYGGQAVGAGMGGLIITAGGMQWLNWAGLVGLLLALGVSALAARAAVTARAAGNALPQA